MAVTLVEWRLVTAADDDDDHSDKTIAKNKDKMVGIERQKWNSPMLLANWDTVDLCTLLLDPPNDWPPITCHRPSSSSSYSAWYLILDTSASLQLSKTNGDINNEIEQNGMNLILKRAAAGAAAAAVTPSLMRWLKFKTKIELANSSDQILEKLRPLCFDDATANDEHCQIAMGMQAGTLTHPQCCCCCICCGNSKWHTQREASQIVSINDDHRERYWSAQSRKEKEGEREVKEDFQRAANLSKSGEDNGQQCIHTVCNRPK